MEYTINNAVIGKLKGSVLIGVSTQAHGLEQNLGALNYGRRYLSYNGNKFKSSTGIGNSYGSTSKTGDIIDVALDIDLGTISFYKNVVNQGIAFNDVKGMYYPTHSLVHIGTSATVNFGSKPFKYLIPESYLPYDVESATWFN